MKLQKSINGISMYTLEPELVKAISAILEVKLTAEDPVIYPRLDVDDPRLSAIETLFHQFGYKPYAGVSPYESKEKFYDYFLVRTFDRADLKAHSWGRIYPGVKAMRGVFDQSGTLLMDDVTEFRFKDPMIMGADKHVAVSQMVKDRMVAAGVTDVSWGSAIPIYDNDPIPNAVPLFHLKPTRTFPRLAEGKNTYYDNDDRTVEWGNPEGFAVHRGEYNRPEYVYDPTVLDQVKGWDCALMFENMGFHVRGQETFFSTRVIELFYDMNLEFEWEPLVFR